MRFSKEDGRKRGIWLTVRRRRCDMLSFGEGWASVLTELEDLIVRNIDISTPHATQK